MRKPSAATLNEQPLAQYGQRRAKVTVAEMIGFAGGGNLQVWFDLPDMADEPLSPGDRVILQPKDEFITAPCDEEQEEFYDVNVLFDGKAKPYRFATNMTVLQVLLQVLPVSDHQHAAAFDLMDSALSAEELASTSTLKDVGVHSGHTLSVTKRNDDDEKKGPKLQFEHVASAQNTKFRVDWSDTL